MLDVTRRATRASHRPAVPTLVLTVVTTAVSVAWTDSALAGGPRGGQPVQPQPRMGDPLPGLTPTQLARFQAGRLDFNHTLLDSEGLGPIFNKASCGNCHNNPLGGPGSQTVTRFGFLDKDGFDPLASLGGSLLQELAISETCFETVPPEANITAHRVTNSSLALGLIEAIPDADLLANRDAQPASLRGIAHMVTAFEDPPAAPLHVGRFGWKAQVATVLTFSADAALNEMGLTNRFITQENAPNGDPDLLLACDSIPDPEDGPDAEGFHFIDRVTHFQRYLARPPQTPRSGMSGEALFNAIGCNACHTPSFTTSNSPELEDAIRNKTIRPYSDFLLHDMGLAADFIVQGAGTEQLLRTPALWGLRRRDPMWHDGRFAADTFANRVTAAIVEHGEPGSQGIPAATAFDDLTQGEKDQLIAFLGSLGQVEFDHDDDDDVDLNDFTGFLACFSGPGSFYTPDDACSISDIDQDGDVDLDDFASFMISYRGPRRDCNSNGIVDLQDILQGAPDNDADAIPDTCEPTCASDMNGDNTIDVNDLLLLIGGWGPCTPTPAPCPADINVDEAVDVNDLLLIIAAWGPCR